MPRRPPEGAHGRQPLARVAQGLSLDYGQEEAIALYGHDPRSTPSTTKRFRGDEGAM